MFRVLILSLLVVSSALAVGAAEEIAIPNLASVQVDGALSEWGEDGFRIEVMGDLAGSVKPSDDFDSVARIAWTAEGLAVALSVSDNLFEEPDAPALAMFMDAVRVAVSNPDHPADFYAVVITPGMTQRFPEPRWHAIDHRSHAETPVDVRIGRILTDAGYQLEILLPWSNLGTVAKRGNGVGFALTLSDNDFPECLPNFSYSPQWPASDEPALLRLARKASPPVCVVADKGRLDEWADMQLTLAAPARLVGESFALQDAGKAIARGRWNEAGGRASCTVTVPEPAARRDDVDTLKVVMHGECLGTISAPDSAALRAKALRDLRVNFEPCVFSGPVFPDCRIAEPVRLRKLVGSYTTRVAFYDAAFQRVDAPETPGRYGAVVEIVPERGNPIRRFRTLVRLPDGCQPWDFEAPVNGDTLKWPQALSLPESTQPDLARLARTGMVRDLFAGDAVARVLAGIVDAKGNEGNPEAATVQWWVDFKRQYYGLPRAVSLARPLCAAVTAPELRTGTPEESGMNAEGVDRIRAFCKTWAVEGGEPFSVCLARNGVVFLHEGYGTVDGAPLSADAPRSIASVYKLVEAVVVMMLVDQGTLDLDAPITSYVPALKTAAPGCAVTLRELFTHTSGLEGHWGWGQADQEEVLADYAAYLHPGKRFDYTSTAYLVAEHVAELTTGTAFSRLQQACLNGPLGLEPVGEDPGAMTSMDLARLGQMLLNRGSYGARQFLSPAACEAMVPRQLTRELGPATEFTWGIGTRMFYEVPSSANTWGQSGYTGTSVRIDPDHNLVMVMARSHDGKDVMRYRAAFLQVIADAIAE